MTNVDPPGKAPDDPVRSRPTLVASDAHLGSTPERSKRSFHAFLEGVADRTDDLVLAGDLFDFWFEYRSVVLREHFSTLRRLADLIDAGVRIRLVAGNHDAWVGSFLEEEIGVEFLAGPTVTDVGGRRTYLAHGDGLAGGDLGYRMLKTVTRSGPARRLFSWLHPDIATALVDRISRTGREAEEGTGSDKKARAEALSDYAAELIRSRSDLELVIFGHSHQPELSEPAEGRFYLNPGDWIHHFTYGLVQGPRVELMKWREA
ncbi:MAG: UDP-2,3-diacylglucosamine diphosphatase [Gemmatimonadota bacterium]